MTKCRAKGHEIKAAGRCPTCNEEKVEERFWARIEKVDGHWLWTGGKNDRGYGGFHVGRGRYIKAHIYAWMLKNGPVPEGMELGHTCEHRHCVLHVRPVTHLQNVREGKVGTPEINQKISKSMMGNTNGRKKK